VTDTATFPAAPPAPTRPPRSQFARILLVIVIVAFGVRVSYVAIAKRGPCPLVRYGEVVGSYPSACAQGDQIFYNAEANSLAAGHGFVEPLWSVTHPGQKAPPAADHPPLTVVVLAGVNWLVEHPPLSAVAGDRFDSNVREDRYAMVLFGTLVVLLIGLLGRRVGRAVPGVNADAVGLVAAGIAAIAPDIWVNDGLVMAETLTVLAVVTACLLAFALWDRPSLLRAAALGACCGLVTLGRAELVLLVPLLGFVVALTTRVSWPDRTAYALVAIVASLVVIGPWVGFNLSRFHDPTFVSTNDGIALAGSNCDNVYYGAGIGLTSISGAHACIDNPPPPGDQSQVEAVYRKRALHYMRTHLGRLPLVVAARIGRTWSVFRPLDMVAFNQGEGREAWVTRLGLVVYYPTLIAAIGGVILMWRRRARRALWVLLVPAIAATVGAAVTYGQTRFRAAAEPSLAILAAVAVVALVGYLRNERSRPTSGAPQAL
jgi:4-amino-4-deoxy-L-arabinose transferase-like glycosyltransferase